MSPALNPSLARVLALCRLEREWVRGSGVWLFDPAGRWFLDCYAQYGAVALGHNPPAGVAALRAALDAGTPPMVQPYRARAAEELAEELVRRAPGELAHCVFVNSGAEAVEAGIKLVRAATGRPLIVAAEGSYHGKTLGTLAAAGDPRHSAGFGPLGGGFRQVPYGDADALARCLASHRGQVAAVLLEPIQGERGVHPPPPGYLAAARALCDEHDAALVLDEVQTGLGRTGRLFACEHEDVAPDVLLLAKALSGGLIPLGACLTTPRFWSTRFALGHSSTFANNGLACAVGLAVLRELGRADLVAGAAHKGEQLLAGLRRLAAKHPAWIEEVRGRGLLCALQLRRRPQELGTFLAVLQTHGLYGYAVAGALARCASLLVLPTLSDPHVLRLAPPLVISEAELELALRGLDGTFAALERHGVALLAGALGEELPGKARAAPPASTPATPAEPAPLPRPRDVGRVDYAFVAHLTRREDILLTNPGLDLDARELEAFCGFAAQLPPVLLCRAPTIRSPAGAEAEGVVIMLPVLPEELSQRGARWACGQIREAVALARELGARVVGLGGHTTPYSRHGRAVLSPSPAITTGNALTAGAALAATRVRVERRGWTLEETPVAVLGAAGSVGSLCTRLLARAGARRLLLVGPPASGLGRLEKLRAELGDEVEVGLTTELARVHDHPVVLAATAATHPVLEVEHLAPGAIVCDLARPADTSAELQSHPDYEVFEGGLVHLPQADASFGPGNLVGLPPGIQLACLAETVLLALEGHSEHTSIGRQVPLETVDALMALAARHGVVPALGREAPAPSVTTVPGAAASGS